MLQEIVYRTSPTTWLTLVSSPPQIVQNLPENADLHCHYDESTHSLVLSLNDDVEGDGTLTMILKEGVERTFLTRTLPFIQNKARPPPLVILIPWTTSYSGKP
jgi:hypothetical protein